MEYRWADRSVTPPFRFAGSSRLTRSNRLSSASRHGITRVDRSGLPLTVSNHLLDSDGAQPATESPPEWWERSDVEIADCSGITVAYLPETDDDAWISGWVDVPR